MDYMGLDLRKFPQRSASFPPSLPTTVGQGPLTKGVMPNLSVLAPQSTQLGLELGVMYDSRGMYV